MPSFPSATTYSGHSRTVIAYTEAIIALVAKAASAPLTDPNWADVQNLVDTEAFERLGVFLTQTATTTTWQPFKNTFGQYASSTAYEATLRHITETPGRVILERHECKTIDGTPHRANTASIYEFAPTGKIRHLDIYVMPLA